MLPPCLALTLDPSLPCNANAIWSEILTNITTLRRTCTSQLDDISIPAPTSEHGKRTDKTEEPQAKHNIPSDHALGDGTNPFAQSRETPGNTNPFDEPDDGNPFSEPRGGGKPQMIKKEAVKPAPAQKAQQASNPFDDF